jgi:NADH:ubiquinone oxidoreductase subunit 2 (subunit N)
MLIIAFSSIFMGSFGAFKARTLKRFLAFSSIVHLGFLVVILSYFFWVKDRMVQGDYLNLFLNLRRLVFGSIESVTEGELLYFSILPNGLLVSLFIGFSVYIFFYFLTTFGLLFLVSQLKKGLRQYGLFFVYISDLKYFSYLKNFLALLLFIIIMFSFGGVPPFGGFFSKFMVFFIVINVGGLVSYWN